MSLHKADIRKLISVLLACALVFTSVIQFGASKTKADSIQITESGGWFEAAYAEWSDVSGATGYKAYVKPAGSADTAYEQLDDELIREYEDYWRADALGLAAGSYVIKVEAVMENADTMTAVTNSISVTSHDRSGYAWVDGTSSGAYNENGTLKSNAVVLYLTEATKDTMTFDVVTSDKGGTTACTGIVAILAAYKRGYDSRPLNIRMIGTVTDSGVINSDSDCKGDIVISGSGNTSRLSCGVTFEGVGEDAMADGWGLRIKNASDIEVRNIAFKNCNSDEGDNLGLQQNNDHVWVHNCDMFYGAPGSDSDQAKGDGALDCKLSTYVTFSYNHFWDNGKCNLLGLSEGTTEGLYITYHHNWYDHSDSRHPRVRYYTAHVYNNYYDGNAKYGIGATSGSSIFAENNYFRNCKYPMLISMQGSDVYNMTTGAIDYSNCGTFSDECGGVIKAYGNTIIGATRFITQKDNATEFDAVVVDSRSDTVGAEYAANQTTDSSITLKNGSAGNTYNNFDTAADFYTYTVDTPEDAKDKVTQYAGRMNGGDFQWTFDNSVDDESYAVNEALKSALTNYTTKLKSIGGMKSSGSGSQEETSASSGGGTQSSAASSGSTTQSGAASSGGTYIHNFTTAGTTSTYFTITGNLSTSKGTVEYNGLTLTQCLKMESSTSITFTAASDATLTLVLDNSKKIKVDGAGITATSKDGNYIVTVALTAGEHTIAKGDSVNLFYMIVEEESADDGTQQSTSATEDPTGVTQSPTSATEGSTSATEGSTGATQSPTSATEGSTSATQAPSSESGPADFELNASDLTVNVYTESFTHNGFTVLASADSTVVVEKNSKTYNGVEYTNRLKTGGEGTADYRSIRFTTEDAATLTAVVVSSSSSASRVMGLSDGSVDDAGKLKDLQQADVGGSVTQIKMTIPAAGTYYLHSTSGGLNFYDIKVTYAKQGGSSSRENDEVREKAPDYKAGDLYVSTTGKASGTGSYEDPMDLVTAINTITPGHTIWMFSGTYYAYDMYQEPVIISSSNNGTESAMKTISSINNKTVTIDFDGMAEESSNRGITLDGDYWHFYDIDIRNAGDNGMLLSGNHNTIELCQFYGNHDTGLQISRYDTSAATIDLWPSYNLILNCTAYNNKDEATAENADGFAAKLTCGEGNVFDGCISYCNSDDGWDLYAKPETGPIGVVTLRNCVAFGNGKLTDGTGSAAGDMNGFKLGGSNGQCPTPHIVENCLAFYNGATGFTDNGNGGAVTMKNCTSVANGVYDNNKANYMCYRTSADAQYVNLLSYVSSTGASTDQFLGVLENVLYHYKDYKSNNSYYWVDSWTCTDGAKTKYTGSEAGKYTVTSSDFVNMTVPWYDSSKQSYADNYHDVFRNYDGSINLDGLFEVKESSSLYTAGTDGTYVGAKFTALEEPAEPPTEAPTEAPTQSPTEAPTQSPTEAPTEAPTQIQTLPSGELLKTELVGISDDVITDDLKQIMGDKGITINTAEELVDYLVSEITGDEKAALLLDGIPAGNTSAVELTVMVSNDNGSTWHKATKDNFPSVGLDIVIPYPAGVSHDYEFIVGHLIIMGCNGAVPGTIEYYTPQKVDRGLKIHINSASPFIVAWKEVKQAEPDNGGGNSGDSGDSDDSEDEPILVVKNDIAAALPSAVVQEVKEPEPATASDASTGADTSDNIGTRIPALMFIIILAAGIALISMNTGRKKADRQ